MTSEKNLTRGNGYLFFSTMKKTTREVIASAASIFYLLVIVPTLIDMAWFSFNTLFTPDVTISSKVMIIIIKCVGAYQSMVILGGIAEFLFLRAKKKNNDKWKTRKIAAYISRVVTCLIAFYPLINYDGETAILFGMGIMSFTQLIVRLIFPVFVLIIGGYILIKIDKKGSEKSFNFRDPIMALYETFMTFYEIYVNKSKSKTPTI